MFRIRRILDAGAPANQAAIAQVQAILRSQFGALREDEISSLPDKLNNPLKFRFQSRLLVAEKRNDTVQGFALILHVPDIEFCILDFIAAGEGKTGQGLGGAIYERVREEAAGLKSRAVLLECLPDDPKLSPDSSIRKQNAQRLAFYERFGAFPVVGTLYETPVDPADHDPPYLVVDALGQPLPSGRFMKKAVRAFLERKYGGLCDPDYTDRVVNSFPDEALSVRQPRYAIKSMAHSELTHGSHDNLVLVANELHEIHHVNERGYVESPVRVKIITRELDKLSFVKREPAEPFADKHILAVHDADYVAFLKKACAAVPNNKSVYPYVFPIRNQSRRPQDTALRAGYYCIDTFTPLNQNAYLAARSAVDCALTAAEWVLRGEPVAYALVRPPGHHAERKAFGGFCYFSNTAIAANYLSRFGRVAILDIDYHHGNGQQDIFYQRSDVFTVSLHGHPKFAYPYFTGFKDEQGERAGMGYNLNMPLGEHITAQDYLGHVHKALHKIQEFRPAYLVIALGLDTAKSDPTGTWSLKARDFDKLGALIGTMSLPTLVVQEGGYRTQTLGINARHFFNSLFRAVIVPQSKPVRFHAAGKMPKRLVRRTVRMSDIAAVRDLVVKTKVFSEEEVDVAGELVAEAGAKGEKASGYSFLFLEEAGNVLGYACYGRVPLTESSYDLYWLVVDPELQRQGIASRLLSAVEDGVRALSGHAIYAETSSTDKYQAARTCYLKAGYVKSSEFDNFYSDGDGKVTFTRYLTKEPSIS